MNIKKFKQIVGPTAEKIKKDQLYEASGSFRPLAELLVEWYERKLAAEETKRKERCPTTVSEIELIPIKAKDGLTFFANCVLDNKFFVGNIAVFTRLDGTGFRCVYPTKVLRNGKQIPIFYPIDEQTGQEIETAISDDAQKLLAPDDNLSDSNLSQRNTEVE